MKTPKHLLRYSHLERKIKNYILNSRLKLDEKFVENDLFPSLKKFISTQPNQFMDFKIIGSGASGLVIGFNRKYDDPNLSLAVKFSPDIEYEMKLLKQIKNTPFTSNIIDIYNNINENYLIMPRMDKITWPYNSKLSNEEVRCSIINYIATIMNGLNALKKVGIISHRDIRPANIMQNTHYSCITNKPESIFEYNIIDLGIASYKKGSIQFSNRRYGSSGFSNDLVSVGQIMYSIIYGKHLFMKSNSMDRTTYADKMKDYRDFIYEEPKRLEKYLKQIDSQPLPLNLFNLEEYEENRNQVNNFYQLSNHIIIKLLRSKLNENIESYLTFVKKPYSMAKYPYLVEFSKKYKYNEYPISLDFNSCLKY